jgi:hypothetical protein
MQTPVNVFGDVTHICNVTILRSNINNFLITSLEYFVHKMRED